MQSINEGKSSESNESGVTASCGPSVSVSVPEDGEAESGGGNEMEADSGLFPAPSSRSSLGVPQQIKSSIGVNNPLNKGGLNKLSPGGLFPLPSSPQVVGGGSATGNPRNKVALGKGFSMMDWIRLTKSGKDLTGVGGYRVGGKVREVTRGELSKHRKRKDAWMALNGAVYNVTAYMDYHPGGWDELVRGAGRDATDMFNEIHRWVNYQGLLEACLVGKLVEGPAPITALPSPPPPPTKPVLPPIPTKPPAPTLDFFQTDNRVTINIYTKRKCLTQSQVTVDCNQDTLKARILLPDSAEAFLVHLQLTAKVEQEIRLKVGSSGKIELGLTKCVAGRWPSLGSGLDKHLWYGPAIQLDLIYRSWTVVSMSPLTRDILHIVLRPPNCTLTCVPPGHHVRIKAQVEGMEIVRNYTPVKALTAAVNPEQETCIHLMVKIYPDGVLSPVLGRLEPGDTVSVSDHTGSFLVSQLEERTGLLLLAAGTGITPMLSILPSLVTTTITKTLIFFNKTEKDIPWRAELDSLSGVKVIHVMSEQEDFTGAQGRINRDLLSPHVSCLGTHPLALVCGPLGFNRAADSILRLEFGQVFDEENGDIHLFEG